MGLYQSGILSNGVLQESAIGSSTGQTIYYSGSGTFTVPTGVTSVSFEGIGGGAAGGGATLNNNAYEGGGGGGYAKTTVSVTPGQQFLYTVGNGGTPAVFPGTDLSNCPGGHTTISAITGTLIMRASGGGERVPTYDNQWMGGGDDLSFPNVGDIIHSGGNGATPGSAPKRTGGGGSAASSSGVGNDGSQSDGNRGVGAGGAANPPYGGAGGNGFGVDTELGYQYGNGFPGSAYGGGGGGGASTNANEGYGGSGATGILIISYTQMNYL